jgi:undecaprenyl-diphosphatase
MIKYIFLGTIQGLTEFFPVSSSGHLVILQKLFGFSQDYLALTVVLHLGTCCSLGVFFFRDILALIRNRKWLFLIFLVTLITGIIGLSAKDFFARLFTSPLAVAVALIVTAIILFCTKFARCRRDNLTVKDALLLGLAQGIAIIPGISRSGITVSTLLFRGIDRKISFTFSFLAAIPAIFGAAILEAKEIGLAWQQEAASFALGFVFSFLAGLFALYALKSVVTKAKLHYFSYYCIIIAIITLLFIKG